MTEGDLISGEPNRSEVGLKNMYVQFPVDYPDDDPPFLPDFREDEPFPGNDPEKVRR
jgi:hypothetical protein